MKHIKKSIVWLRRDLRLEDHRALFEAQELSETIYLVFVFDPLILKALNDPYDQRISFIHQTLLKIEHDLKLSGGGLHILYDTPQKAIPALYKQLNCDALFFNRDYEPYARHRDQSIIEEIQTLQGEVFTFQDHVIYEPECILKADGTPYKVFTPYKKKWLNTFYDQGSPCGSYQTTHHNIAPGNHSKYLTSSGLELLGFKKTQLHIKADRKEGLNRLSYFQQERLEHYDKNRDFPAIDGTSLLSVYLRFGLVSIREVVQAAVSKESSGHQVWLSEIIWREFYQMILWHFPHVQNKPFKSKYAEINWQGLPEHFEAWCNGKTGFPIIDAAMRCLNKTGLMPNRLRMISASFLCKTLLINWQLGEQYFAKKLLDFDLAANNGGWQWCASSGCDSQPYFRIFNPYTQSTRFDQSGQFIKEWCPELKGLSDKAVHNPSLSHNEITLGIDYPHPIVDYPTHRKRALDMYKTGLKNE